MPTTNAGTFTATRDQAVVDPAGNVRVTLLYAKTTGNLPRMARTLTIPANSAQPIVDADGTTVAAGGTYAALASAITAFISALDTAIANGASGGKLDL